MIYFSDRYYSFGDHTETVGSNLVITDQKLQADLIKPYCFIVHRYSETVTQISILKLQNFTFSPFHLHQNWMSCQILKQF